MKPTGFARALATCIVVVSVATNIVAQRITIHVPTPQGQKQSQSAQQQYAVQIVECESPGCTPGQGDSPIWHLNGTAGMGQFGTGNQQLTVEHITASAIAVRRVDSSAFKALYTGVIQGNRIFGSVLYYDANNPNIPRTGVWNGTIQGSLATLKPTSAGLTPTYPFTLRECESNRCLQPGTQYPITWTFPSRDGQGWLNDKPRPMTIETLTPGFIVARRDDTAALGGLVAYYFGEISGNQIIGSVLYIDANRPNQPRSDSWYGQLQPTFVQEQAMSSAQPNNSPTPNPPATPARATAPSAVPNNAPATVSSTAPTAPAIPASASSSNLEIAECDLDDPLCSFNGAHPTFEFTGRNGVGHYHSSTMQVQIEHVDPELIAFRVTSQSDQRGLSVLYMGRIDGKNITGVSLIYQPGYEGEPAASAWNGTITRGSLAAFTSSAAPSLQYPFTLNDCEGRRCDWGDADFSTVWTFPSKDGQGWVNDHPRPLIVEDFHSNYFLVRRFESAYGMTAYYFGEVKGRTVNGGVLYFNREQLDQPKAGAWFGKLRDNFTPEVAMNEPEGASAAAVKKTDAPQKIIVCAFTLCVSATRNGDKYIGYYDGQPDNLFDWTIKEWDGPNFILAPTHQTTKDGVTFNTEFRGRIAPSGDHTQWGILLQYPSDPVAFGAVWGNTHNDDGMTRRSKMFPSIEVPPYASEKYAAYDGRVRAVMMEDHYSLLSHADLLKPCAQTSSVNNGDAALEIAKYAYRADELPRGNCWSERAVALNNPKGETLLALAMIVGWNGHEDQTGGCKRMESNAGKDLWAQFILSGCYAGVFGDAKDFPNDPNKANQIANSWNDGQLRIIHRYLSDDLDWLRDQERQKVLDDPPMKAGDPPYCIYADKSRCPHNDIPRVVDRDELNRRLKEVDHRYAAMP
jgi:hypothetical protein